MVYYGALSKGCQRCRQRKIKCDQRRPGCLKCDVLREPCPGYRNLTDITFRDEAKRIKRRFYTNVAQKKTPLREEPKVSNSTACSATNNAQPDPECLLLLPRNVPSMICQTIDDQAANFFFAYYTTNGPPFCDSYQTWLAKTYLEDCPHNVVRDIIQAIGMAAIANVFNAPDMVLEAKRRYGRALTVANTALRDPAQVTADSTLMAILLLGLFETVTFENWKTYRTWTAHTEGATALLQLRGQDQFSRELGTQLFIQFRNQILQACVQNGVQVPAALVEVSTEYEVSRSGKQRNDTRPFSLALIGFKIVNINADIKSLKMTDADAICRLMLDINSDLQAWASLQGGRAYMNIDIVDGEAGGIFNGKRHFYKSAWGAQIWNNWRSLGILINQIILSYVDRQICVDDNLKNIMRLNAMTSIRSLSEDICISIPNLAGTPRSPTTIWPLYMVSQEKTNSPAMRSWAADQLHGIKISMGINQAAVLADDACPNWRGELDFMPHMFDIFQ